jgi:hypothetical protein
MGTIWALVVLKTKNLNNFPPDLFLSTQILYFFSIKKRLGPNILLAPIGVLAPESGHGCPFARPSINTI